MLKRLGLGRESSLRITVHLQTPSWHSELHSPSWMMTVLPEAKVQLILYRMVHAEEYLADRQLSEFRLRLLFTCIHEHMSECVCVWWGDCQRKETICLPFTSCFEHSNSSQRVSQSNFFPQVVCCCKEAICEKNQWRYTNNKTNCARAWWMSTLLTHLSFHCGQTCPRSLQNGPFPRSTNFLDTCQVDLHMARQVRLIHVFCGMRREQNRFIQVSTLRQHVRGLGLILPFNTHYVYYNGPQEVETRLQLFMSPVKNGIAC